MSDASVATTALLTTPLDALHRELGGRMVPFAGYAMPVQYPTGIIAEHTWCREKAGLFDVSHMGQAWLLPAAGKTAADIPAAFETLVPTDYLSLKAGRQRYSMFTNAAGGILDDLMLSHISTDRWFLVVNAACKEADFAHLRQQIGDRVTVEVLTDRALLALQGPQAAEVMAHFAPATASMVFMDAGPVTVAGIPCLVSRSGYTGEDGFEISVPTAQAETLARLLLGHELVKPIGLGARDSLRLEAGLPLYGSDMDETVSPVEASLTFALSKRRRAEGGFPGAETIQDQLANGTRRRRVGIRIEGRLPARAHAAICTLDGALTVGEVTSGGFSPTLGCAIAVGLVDSAHAAVGTSLALKVRDKLVVGQVVPFPFVAQRYHRG